VRKAPSPRRRWRREVLFCLYDGKSSMRSPRLRAVLAAVHWGRCTRFALPHASSITRRSPGVVARILPMFESKVLRRSVTNYALMLRSCNGSRQHFLDCCVHATWIEAIDGFRRRNRCGSLRLSSSTAIEEPAWRTRVQWRVCGVGNKVSFPAGNVLHGCYPTAPSLTPAIPEASGSGGARPGCPSRPAFRAAKLSINAENPGTETTTR